MSKIHQAIRRAEREGRSSASQSVERETHSRAVEYLVKDVSRQTTSLSGHQSVSNKLRALPTVELEPKATVDLRISPAFPIVSLMDPRSLASSQYRLLRKELLRFRQSAPLKTLGITSISASEGKTLTAINLALTMAHEINERILLVDSASRPSVHSALGLPSGKGLSDALKGEITIRDAVLKTRISNFSVVTWGSMTEGQMELLQGTKIKDTLSSLVEFFDWVILDAGPLIPFGETESVLSFVDGVLVVVGPEQTPQFVSSGIQPLKEKNLLGFVLNGIHSETELGVER
jgi:receptor protein-tyrosine kinase/non-specific protein-tyrosine kinase